MPAAVEQLTGRMRHPYLAKVVSVQDPDNLGRVQVRVLAFDGVADHDAPVWARVAVPFAGNNYGALFIPDVEEEVLVAFLQGDPRFPIVIGSLWNGSASQPETIGGNSVDRWTLTGKAGTRVAIVEQQGGQPTIEFETPGGVSGKLTDDGGGKIELKTPASSITIENSTINVQTGGKVKVQASKVDVSAGMVSVDAGMSKFSGVVQCDTLIATSVVGSSYTPGAGNVW